LSSGDAVATTTDATAAAECTTAVINQAINQYVYFEVEIGETVADAAVNAYFGIGLCPQSKLSLSGWDAEKQGFYLLNNASANVVMDINDGATDFFIQSAADMTSCIAFDRLAVGDVVGVLANRYPVRRVMFYVNGVNVLGVNAYIEPTAEDAQEDSIPTAILQESYVPFAAVSQGENVTLTIKTHSADFSYAPEVIWSPWVALVDQ